jgi:hypothetical protein
MDSVISWVMAAILSCGGLIFCLFKAASEKARYKKENEEFFTHFNTSLR